MICPKCMKDIAPENVNMQYMAAKCDYCREVFSFAGNFPEPQWNQSGHYESLPPPQPTSLRVENLGTRLVMSYKWPTTHLFMFIPFTIAWNGFLLGWYSIVLTIPGAAKAPFLVFPLVHLVFGITMIHQCLKDLFNSTTVTVDRNTLSVKNGPIPAGGNCSVPVHDIEQLFCRDIQVRGKKASYDSYSLHAVLHGGLRRDLLSGQTDREVVVYMEWMIENYLNIENRPVPGELGDTQEYNHPSPGSSSQRFIDRDDY